MLTANNPLDFQSRLTSVDPEVRRIAVMNLLDSDEDDIEALLLTALQDADEKCVQKQRACWRDMKPTRLSPG